MSIFIKIRNFLSDPRIKGVDVNSDELLVVHRRILMEKKMMNKVFSDFYSKCISLDKKYLSGDGLRIEIGAGVSFFKQKYPEIVSTDIKKAENLDRVLDAQNMDLDNKSVRAFYGLNCFHHFPEPEKFFKELQRVLVPGGGCILIEPYHGFVASHFYKKLFDTETFDKTQQRWVNTNSEIMQGANQALSYVVFKRDLKKFHSLYPDLEIVLQSPLNNYLQYLLSGGLNFRSLVPSTLQPLVKFFEIILFPLNKFLALHHIILIRKKYNQDS